MSIMILTNSGHIALATAIKNQQMFLAWGDIPPFLTSPGTPAATVVGNGALISGNYSYQITAINPSGETPPSTAVPVTISTSGQCVSLSWAAVVGATGYNVYGRFVADAYKLIATVTTNSYVDNGTVQLGTVQPPSANTTSATPWTSTVPIPTVTPTGLYRELGRRKVSLVQYVYPDINGPIVTTQGRWSTTNTPTQYVYAYVAYDLADAASSTIYQFGLFIGTVPTSDQTNATYLLPSQIANPGSLLALENIPPIYRNVSSREIHELVMTF